MRDWSFIVEVVGIVVMGWICMFLCRCQSKIRPHKAERWKMADSGVRDFIHCGVLLLLRLPLSWPTGYVPHCDWRHPLPCRCHPRHHSPSSSCFVSSTWRSLLSGQISKIFAIVYRRHDEDRYVQRVQAVYAYTPAKTRARTRVLDGIRSRRRRHVLKVPSAE